MATVFRTLTLAAVLAALSGGASAGPVFGAASYGAAMTFQDGGPGTTMTMAWDGTNFYSGTGGYASSPLVKYDAAGNVIGSVAPTPGIDFRSVFTNSANELLARGVASRTIYRQDAVFGSFSSLVSLSGGTLDVQSAVVLNGSGTEYIARIDSTVSRWDLAGNHLGATTLGSAACSAYPEERGIAAAGIYWLTYCAGTVYAFDASGALLDSATLTGAGTGFDSHFSFSYAQDKFWVVDQAGGTWRGYDLGLGADVEAGVPLPGTAWLAGAALLALGWQRRRRPAG